MSPTSLSLFDAVALLRRQYGPPRPPPTADPFELVLFENVAYLASPERRREAFALLKATVGTSPAALLAARDADLETAASKGILKGTSAAKLRACARIAAERFDGDLRAALAGTLAEAKRALRAFPGIGEPGAEKILLLAGLHPFLAPESNGLRVLVRLGLAEEGKSYGSTYAAGRGVAKELAGDIESLREAHLLLQVHGQTLCKRTAPRCGSCPLRAGCAHALREREG